MSGFTRAQVDQLLRPINRNRVLSDGKGHSHVSQQDVVAHLIRVFGFGSFDTEVVSHELVFEEPRYDKKTGEATGRWDVCYRTLLRLTVKDADGNAICHFEDGSTATAQNQTRGDGHDLAYKSSLSLAKKRCAINLGDQFGLSLYNKGQLEALVMGSLILPDGETAEADMQEGVTEQVALGNDEVDRDLDGTEDAGGPPRNKDGSLSRSRMSDEELAAAGTMTRAQMKEHNAFAKDVQGDGGADRVKGTAPDDEFYTAPPEPDGKLAQQLEDELKQVGDAESLKAVAQRITVAKTQGKLTDEWQERLRELYTQTASALHALAGDAA